jgi:hypothetical protein
MTVGWIVSAVGGVTSAGREKVAVGNGGEMAAQNI